MPGVEPKKLLLRRRDVLEWSGIAVAEFHALLEAGIIQPKKLKKNGRGYYDKEHIRAALKLP